MIIKSLLDCDLYKFTMQQAMFHHYPNASAKYRFICRNKGVNLIPFKNLILKELEHLCSLSFNPDEISYLRNLGYFQDDYLDYLKTFQLSIKNIHIFEKDNNLVIEAEGLMYNVTMFEIYTLSIVNEIYFNQTQPNTDLNIGREKLKHKISLIKGADNFKLIDFGTRRRFSGMWQIEVNKILKENLPPENFIGTSSVFVAKQLGLKPIGTFAHEWLQLHQVMAEKLINSQKMALDVWLKEYNGKLAIALSDIYGTEPFLKDFNFDLALKYQGVRHDSGDPFAWGEKIIAHYQTLGFTDEMIKSKTLVFSDGLNVEKAIKINDMFKGRINTSFGIGTNLTNDFDFSPLNIVMKMVACNGKPVAKISDEPSKAICDDDLFLKTIKETFHI